MVLDQHLYHFGRMHGRSDGRQHFLWTGSQRGLRNTGQVEVWKEEALLPKAWKFGHSKGPKSRRTCETLLLIFSNQLEKDRARTFLQKHIFAMVFLDGQVQEVKVERGKGRKDPPFFSFSLRCFELPRYLGFGNEVGLIFLGVSFRVSCIFGRSSNLGQETWWAF